jgi:hypothetical protein
MRHKLPRLSILPTLISEGPIRLAHSTQGPVRCLPPSNAALCTHIFVNLTQDFRAHHLSLFYVERPRAIKPQITVPLSVWHFISCERLGMKLMQGGVGGCPRLGGSKWCIRYSVTSVCYKYTEYGIPPRPKGRQTRLKRFLHA